MAAIITPTKAKEMLQDQRSLEDLKAGLLDGRYEFDYKHIRFQRQWRKLIDWSWIIVQVPSGNEAIEVVDDDGETIFRIE